MASFIVFERMTTVSSNRNRYTSAPMYGLKNKKLPVSKSMPQEAPQQPVQQPVQQPQQQYQPQQGYPQQGGYMQQGYPQQQPAQDPWNPQPYPQQQNVWQQSPWQQPQQPQQQRPQMQQNPKARQGHRYNWLIAVVTLVLPILFIAALIAGSPILHGVFIVSALSVITVLLIARPFSTNARYTLALVYGAMAVVMAVALLFSLPARDSRQVPASANLDAQALFGGSSALDSVSVQQQTPVDPETENAPAVQGNTQSADESMASMRLNTFMNYWAESQLDSMLELCLPSWVNNLENPKSELFILLANRAPISYTVENISGSEADSSRTVTLTVLIDKKNTSEPAYYQMQVLMLRLNDTWYVDPNSLGATKMATTPQPGDQEAGTIPFVPTQAPTEAPTISANTYLYYNPDGGLYYHAQENCRSVAEEYLPLKAFYYSDLNNTTFKNLLACHKCDAPARPVITGN